MPYPFAEEIHIVTQPSCLLRGVLLASFCGAVFPSHALAAGASGSIRGKVVGPDGQAMSAVALQLRYDVTGFTADAITAPDGAFQFFNVPFNPYELRVDAQGFRPYRKRIEVRSSAAQDVQVSLALAGITESVTISAETGAAQLETDTSTSHVDIDKSYVARAPAAIASRAMEELITATPGFAKDENGRYHFQGAHSQGQFVVDGQPISDQTGITFSNSIDPGIAQSMEVIYGNVPAEYGEKTGTVVNLVTKSGLGKPFHGELQAGAARYSTYEGGLSVGGGSRNLAAFASLDGSWSDRFLDPVNFDNLHNTGQSQRGFLRLDYASDDLSDQLRFTVLVGRTNRDVPNTFSQQDAGQDQQVRSRDENYNLGWTHTLSSKATLEASAFGRVARFELLPSALDTPVTARSDRSLDNYGSSATVNWSADSHNEVKVGGIVKRFPIEETLQLRPHRPRLQRPRR